MSTLERWTGAVWSNEANLLRFTLIDEANLPQQLEATIGDPNNSIQGNYSNFTRVRIIEDSTSRIIFYGKVIFVQPALDAVYGQTFTINARDNLQELLERLVDTNYTNAGATPRSSVISTVISDHSTTVSGTPNIGTADTQKFVASAVSESGDVLNLNFDNSGKNALRVIYELAEEDPWDASRTGIGSVFYLDQEFSSTSPIPDVHFFRRGARPSGGASTNGLTVQLNASETAQLRSMLPDYSFPRASKELATRCRVKYLDATGAPQELFAIIVNHGAVTAGPFVVGNTVTWPGGGSATIHYVGNTYLVVGPSSSGSTAYLISVSGLLLTSGATTATANAASASPPGSLRESIEQDIEIVPREYQVASITEARAKAAAILFQGGNTITRGEVKIVRWPYYSRTGTHSGVASATVLNDAAGDFLNYGIRNGDVVTNTTNSISGTITTVTATQLTVSAGGMSWDAGDAYRVYIMVRAGHVVRINNSNLSINEDMLVTKIIYDEGPGIIYATISVLGNATSRGKTAPRLGLKEIKEDIETALWETPAAAGGLPTGSQIANINFVFSTPASNQISWPGGTITYSDGSTETINATGSPFTIPTDDTFYIYKERNRAALRITRNFSGANDPTTADPPVVGINNALISIAKRSSDTTQDAMIVSLNSGSPVIATGILLANELSAITANMGLLTAGEIRVGSGAFPGSFTGFHLDPTRFAGRNAGTIQVEILASTGRLTAGAGAVTISSTGILINGTALLNFEGGAFQDVYLANNQAGAFQIIPTGVGTATTTLNLSLSTIEFSASPFTITSLTIPSTLIIGLGSGGILRSAADAQVDLGTSSIAFNALYLKDAAAINLLPFGGLAGNTSEIRFQELTANGVNYVGFKAPDLIAANIIWTLPNVSGTTSQAMTDDGTGLLTWRDFLRNAATTNLNMGTFNISNVGNITPDVVTRDLGSTTLYWRTLIVSFGPVTAPSISFQDDTDTGMASPGPLNSVDLIGGAQTQLRAQDPADTEVGILVRQNVGGVFTLKRVSMGATDSGGVGFKLLRVANT